MTDAHRSPKNTPAFQPSPLNTCSAGGVRGGHRELRLPASRITRERTKAEIRKSSVVSLRKFTAQGSDELIYRKRIREMCVSNRQSLEVSYLHLSQREPMLAICVADAPADILSIFDDVAKKEALKLYPAYESIARDIYVRVTELPIPDQIRDIRQAHLNCLIKISGVVTRRTGVFPQLQEVMYDCAGAASSSAPST